MLKITFLGTGGSMPSKDRNVSAIAIHAKELFLFDCGEGTQRQMMKFKVPYGSIDCIFITHAHLDHYLGMYGIIETYKQCLPTRKLKIFAPNGVNLPEDLFTLKRNNVEFTRIKKEGKIYENKEYEVHAYKVEHRSHSYGFILKEKDRIKFHEKKAKSLGLKGELFSKIQEKGKLKVNGKTIKLKDITWVKKGKKIVYTGDTLPSKNTIKAAKGADLLIHESSFLEDEKEKAKEYKHTTAKQAAQIAKKAKVNKLILTHISTRYKTNKEILGQAQKIFKKVEVANDGFNVEV